VKRRQRDVAFEIGEDGCVHQHRPVVARAAMHDPMPHGDRLQLLRLAQPGSCERKRGRRIAHALRRVGRIDQPRPIGRRGAKPRPHADAIHLALDQPLEGALPVGLVHLELDARGAGVDDEDGVHRSLRRRQRRRAAARMRIEHCDRAGRQARAHGIGA